MQIDFISRYSSPPASALCIILHRNARQEDESPRGEACSHTPVVAQHAFFDTPHADKADVRQEKKPNCPTQ